MAGATTNSQSEAIQQAFAPSFVDEVLRNNALLSLSVRGRPAFPERTSPGDTAYRWKVRTSGNANVEIYTEGQALPDASAQNYVDLAVSYNYYRGVIEVTGHLRDALRSRWFDSIDQEFQGTFSDIGDLVETTMLGAANNGIQVAIDSTTTYAGQARGSASWWESTETAVGGALTRAQLATLDRTMRDDKRANVGVHVVPYNQEENYSDLTGVAGDANNSVRVNMNTTGTEAPTFDLGYKTAGLSFKGVPIVPVHDLTDTIWLGLDISPGSWAHVIHRPFTVHDQGRSADADRYQISFASILVCFRAQRQGKLTGVTA